MSKERQETIGRIAKQDNHHFGYCRRSKPARNRARRIYRNRCQSTAQSCNLPRLIPLL